MDCRFCGLELHGLSQCHAESFVDHAVVDGVDGRFQDVRARRAVEGQPDARTIENHWQLVLGSSQGKPQTLFSRQHGATRQFIQDGNDFLVAQPLNVIAAARHRQGLPRFKEGHGSGAFAADVVQQRKVILARHLKLLRNQAAHLPFG
ncbi:hypothetical protein D3C71_1533270 [compost metagenome]